MHLSFIPMSSPSLCLSIKDSLLAYGPKAFADIFFLSFFFFFFLLNKLPFFVLVAASRGYSLGAVHGLLIAVASLVAEHRV